MMAPVPQPEDERDKPGHHPDDGELDNLDYPEVIINADSSDSDDDEEEEQDDETGSAYLGYQSLSQNLQDSDSDEEEEEEQVSEPRTGLSPEIEMGGNGIPELHVPEGVLHQLRQAGGTDPANLPSYMQVPDMPRPTRQELLWNQPATGDLSLDGGQMEKIKTVMAGIQLPTSSIPDWAKTISDDQWQSQIVSRLVHKEPKHRHEYTVKSDDQSSTKKQNSDEKESGLKTSHSVAVHKDEDQVPG